MSPARALGVLLVALGLLAGCGGDRTVGRVGDTELRLSEMSILFEGGAAPAADFRVTLYRVMAVEALDQALEAEFGVTVQPEQVEASLAAIESTLAQSGQTYADYLGIESASREMLRLNARVVTLRDVAVPQLLKAPDVVDDLFADPVTLTSVCSRQILLPTEEEAEGVLARLAAGEDFATVADEIAGDAAGRGGDLGCLPAATLVAEYADAAMGAAIGEVAGPVVTRYGYHVLVVYERTTPTREEYLADPSSVIPDQARSDIWTDWFNRTLFGADAWVAPEYGTWTAEGIMTPGAGG